MSLTSIADHHRKWEALPAFPDYPYVMTDDDVNAWSDLLYMRGLVDTIEDIVCDARIDIPHDNECGPLPRSIEFDVDLYIDPWPRDVAGQLIDSWKAAA